MFYTNFRELLLYNNNNSSQQPTTTTKKQMLPLNVFNNKETSNGLNMLKGSQVD